MPDSRKPEATAPPGAVPKAVVGRLSLYLRELQRLVRDENETTSSTQIGKLLGFTDAQVRKDLAYFGQFGYPGIGYRCGELIVEIRRILGTDRDWPIALVGIGNLGRALLGYKGFNRQGFRIVAAFDMDPEKIGKTVGGLKIHSMHALPAIAAEHGIKMAMLSVPAEAAQPVADLLVQAGISGILNFAPVTLSLPSGVDAEGVDLAIELEQLSFAVINKRLAASP